MATTVAATDEVYSQVKDAYSYRSEHAITEALSKKITISLGYALADMADVPVDACQYRRRL